MSRCSDPAGLASVRAWHDLPFFWHRKGPKPSIKVLSKIRSVRHRAPSCLGGRYSSLAFCGILAAHFWRSHGTPFHLNQVCAGVYDQQSSCRCPGNRCKVSQALKTPDLCCVFGDFHSILKGCKGSINKCPKSALCHSMNSVGAPFFSTVAQGLERSSSKRGMCLLSSRTDSQAKDVFSQGGLSGVTAGRSALE